MHFETCEILFLKMLSVRLVQITLVWVFGTTAKCKRLCIIMLSIKNWVKYSIYKRRQWRGISFSRIVKTRKYVLKYYKKRSRFCIIKRSKSWQRLIWWSLTSKAQINWNSSCNKKSRKKITDQHKDKRNISSWNKHLKIT